MIPLGMNRGRSTDELHVLACTGCPRVSSFSAKGWKSYRVEDPDDDGEPELAFYCPECAREFSESRESA
jgi:hypothetical protein